MALLLEIIELKNIKQIMKLKLPEPVLNLLKKQGGTVNSKLRATKTRLTKTCEEHRYPLHDSEIAFEAAFGGLMIPDEPKQKSEDPCWLFGTHACLTSNTHTDPRGGSKARKLVPVVYSPNDIIYYLDEQGRAYAEDTIEDEKARLYADNGTSLVCRIILHETLFSRKETSLDLPGLKAEELSKQIHLHLVVEASGKDFRFFSDAKGDVLVVEDIKAKRTQFTGATKKHLHLIKQAVPTGTKKTSPELKPFLGKTNVRMVGEQRTSLPEFFEQLPDLRELDVSINKLETLHESLWKATQIKHLDLSFNPLKQLPDGIGNMKSLSSLVMRACEIETLPQALTNVKNLSKLNLSECTKLDVDKALQVIAQLPKLKELSLPLSHSLTSLAPLAKLPLKYLMLNGMYVEQPDRLPAGLAQLKKLSDLRIQYADNVALLPDSPEDVKALRLIFNKRFTDNDIRQSALKQPEKLYLQAFVKTL